MAWSSKWFLVGSFFELLGHLEEAIIQVWMTGVLPNIWKEFSDEEVHSPHPITAAHDHTWDLM